MWCLTLIVKNWSTHLIRCDAMFLSATTSRIQGPRLSLEEAAVVVTTASDMTLQAVEDILRAKATKRNLSLKIFDFQPAETVGGNRVQQTVKLKKGLSQELAKKMSKMVRDEMKKVTVAIQGKA